MRIRAIIIACSLAVATAGGAMDAAAAQASSPAVTAVRAVYRTVLTAEYFGPGSAVCSHLTAAGVKSFTAGGAGTCKHAFQQQQQQHMLKHKIKDDDNSGYTPTQWRQEVSFVMAHLKVSVHGAHASAIGGESGIPGRTTLVEVGGKWLFSSYPPSVQS
ncbi:MAG TPA: hypothetical protein VIJ20_12755 [Solirubrobacteraceae bacterium]